MSLLEKWHETAYKAGQSEQSIKKFWDDYFLKEKNIYKILLSDRNTEIKGTVKELSDKFNITTLEMAGFLEGINDSLIKENPIETMTEDTKVSLLFDNEKLYRNMVEAKAPWLYELEEWDDIFSKEERDKLYKDQKKLHTVLKPKKIGRNDPCPCGSNKKYKFCCGKK